MWLLDKKHYEPFMGFETSLSDMRMITDHLSFHYNSKLLDLSFFYQEVKVTLSVLMLVQLAILHCYSFTSSVH